MIGNKSCPVARPIEDSVAIVSRLTGGQGISVLPKYIARNTVGLQCGYLPGSFNGGFGRCYAVFFEDAGLTDGGADRAVVVYPAVAPVIGFAPY